MPNPVTYAATIKELLRTLFLRRTPAVSRRDVPARRSVLALERGAASPSKRHIVMWAFRVRGGREAEFERLYGASGDWVRLLRRSRAYLGTELWRDRDEPSRYITVDRWRSRGEFERFMRAVQDEYAVLDARGRQLTISEARLASLERIGA